MAKVKGHYRTLADGKRVFVQDHERLDAAGSSSTPAAPLSAEALGDIEEQDEDQKREDTWDKVWSDPGIKTAEREFGAQVAQSILSKAEELSATATATHKATAKSKEGDWSNVAKAHVTSRVGELATRISDSMGNDIRADSEFGYGDLRGCFSISHHLPHGIQATRVPDDWDYDTCEAVKDALYEMGEDDSFKDAYDDVRYSSDLDEHIDTLSENILEQGTSVAISKHFGDAEISDDEWDVVSSRDGETRDYVEMTMKYNISKWAQETQENSRRSLIEACVKQQARLLQAA